MKIANPIQVKERILYYKGRAPGTFSYSTGAMVGQLNVAFEKDEHRRLALGWLFNDALEELSTHKLHPAEWYGLKMWIGARPAEVVDGKTIWKPRDAFPVEARWISTVLHALQNGLDLGQAIKMVTLDAAHNPLVTSAIALGGSVFGGPVLMDEDQWKELSIDYHEKNNQKFHVQALPEHGANNPRTRNEVLPAGQPADASAGHVDNDSILLRLLQGG